MSHAVVVEGVGKKFHRFELAGPRTLKDALLRGLRGVWPVGSFWVLRNVSFQLEAGRALGIIGRNGAGKSTLLRLIGGVGRPDEGQITVHGRIGGLLDLSVGFDPELTGRENAVVSGVVRGLTRRQMRAQLDSIISFAGLSEVIDQPLRTYSTGMCMRLGFSISINALPDVLLVDEVLSVGDREFVEKCVDRIEALKAQGCAIIGVSHDLESIESFCDEALLLEDGELAAYGTPAEVIAEYTNTPVQDGPDDVASALPSPGGEMEITDVQILIDGKKAGILKCSEQLSVRIAYNAHKPITGPIIFVKLLDANGLTVFECDSLATGFEISVPQGGGHFELALERLDLLRGQYTLDVGVGEKSGAYAYDYRPKACSLVVAKHGIHRGFISPPISWRHLPS